MDFKKIQTISFFGLLIGVSILFYQLIEPYLFALFWAAVITTLFYPMYTKINTAIKNEGISAALSVVIVVLIVLIPLSAVFGLVVKQGIGTYAQINTPETINTLKLFGEDIVAQPWVVQIAGDINVEEELRAMSSTITSKGIGWLKVGSLNTLSAIVQILIMLYSLYYFFQKGPEWLERLMYLLPFGDTNEKILYEKFASTGKATLKGTILLGGIQGILGGILFFIVGIPSAAFWGLVMVVLSIIPAVGSFIVWFPAVIYLLVTGQVWQAIVVLIGGLIIGLLDNLLRPPLVGKDIQMHPILILFSTIGGLALVGISGVVIGPMIAAFFMAILDMYEIKYKKELKSTST